VKPGHCEPTMSAARRGQGTAFTVAELLVVIGIIALLATIALPITAKFGKGTTLNAATRQLLDDLSLARMRAINGRTTVYVVFVPTDIAAYFNSRAPALRGSAIADERRLAVQLSNVVNGVYSAYALVSKRTVGDQPGREHPRYLTEWKRLPAGVAIPPYKFVEGTNPPGTVPVALPLEYRIGFNYRTNMPLVGGLPFPVTDAFDNAIPFLRLPVIGFNAQGQLLPPRDGVAPRDEIIPLGEGSVFFPWLPNGTAGKADLVMKPEKNWTNNFIRVNWLTGRAMLERKEMK
jgi:hypothetical protein